MNTDILIVGSGMAGATLACALKLNNPALQITLVDAQPEPSSHTSQDSRWIALNIGSINLLKKLDLFKSLQLHAEPIHTVHVSRRGQFGSVRLNAAELNLSALGVVISAAKINQVLTKKLQQLSIQQIRPAKVTEIIKNQDSIEIMLNKPEGENYLKSKLLIAADGTHSTIRNLLAIPTKEYDYQQSAMVTTIGLRRSHQQIAYERFVEKGAIAMLPLPNHHCAMIWSAKQEQINYLMQLNHDDFLQTLQKEFGSRLGQFQTIHQRETYPLCFMKARQQVDDRIILIGNAAHTIHPLAAQGLNTAFREIAILSELFKNQSINLLDLKNLKIVENSFFEKKFNIHLSHWLNILFSIDFMPLNVMRQIGMIGFDQSGILKKRFAAYTTY